MTGFITVELNEAVDNFIAKGPYYIGLLTALPNAAGTGGTEVGVVEYARQSISFGAASNGLSASTSTVTFPQPTSTGGYGEIVGYGLFTDPLYANAPNPRCVLGVPSGSFSMPVGFTYTYPVGHFTIQIKLQAV